MKKDFVYPYKLQPGDEVIDPPLGLVLATERNTTDMDGSYTVLHHPSDCPDPYPQETWLASNHLVTIEKDE